MRNLLKTLFIAAIAINLAACNPYRSYQLTADEYLQKNEDVRSKYGFVLVRGIRLGDKSDMEQYIKNPSNKLLTNMSNSIHIFVQPVDTTYPSYFFGEGIDFYFSAYKRKSTIQSHFYSGLDTKLVHTARKRESLFNVTPAILKPEFFYDIVALKIGKYCVSSLIQVFANAIVQVDLRTKDRCIDFEVKAGQVNYIGDIFWTKGITTPGFFGSTYANIYALNRADQAKQFMDDFEPKLDLQFTSTMLKLS